MLYAFYSQKEQAQSHSLENQTSLVALYTLQKKKKKLINLV